MTDRNLIDLKKDNYDLDTQTWNLFFDWFCTEKSLPNRGKTLVRKLEQVLKANEKGKLFNPAEVTVIFKNNCPMYGEFYDDFRICDLESGDVLFCICPKFGYENENYSGKSGISARLATGEMKEVVRGKWADVLKFFEGYEL